MQTQTYIGNELEVFKLASNWKQYYGGFIKPFIHGQILEVGAGIGETTKSLCNGSQKEWVCLEPDGQLFAEVKKKVDSGYLPSCCKPIAGTIENLSESQLFDAILYIDVIEHIEDDKAELEKAAKKLKPGGALIVLVPAHQWLFSNFDKAIGHYRRYNKKMLREVAPEKLTLSRLMYLDSVGLIASATNKLLLKQKNPTKKQVLFWDKVIVNLSKPVDRLSGFKAGKSVLAVWHNE